jgi:hypothetical protein
MRRNAAWIEPTLVSEWARLMRDYAKGQERNLAEETIIRSMQWADPERDVSQARQVAISILEHTGLRCVWTDQPLNRNTLDIDHMFPWTAWPCSDLWNLLPAHRHVNPAAQTRPPAIRLHDVSRRGQDHRLVGTSLFAKG